MGSGTGPHSGCGRPVRRLAVAGGIAAAFVAGALVATPDRGGPPGGTPVALPPTPAAFHGELRAAGSCDALLDQYVDRALDVVGPYGWDSYVGYGLSDDLVVTDAQVPGAVSGLARTYRADAGRAELSVAKAEPSTHSGTGTNVQEAGGRRARRVKTDGEMLVRLDDAELTTYDVTGAAVERPWQPRPRRPPHGEILLAGDTVVAIGDDGTRPARSQPYTYQGQAAPQTRVMTIDVSDPADPTLVDTVDYDTRTVTARQHGDDVRLVLSAGLPDLDFVQPMRGHGRRTGARSAQDANEQLVRQTTLADWLPRVSTDGGASAQLLDCDDVAVPRADLALDTMAVVGFDAGDPAERPGASGWPATHRWPTSRPTTSTSRPATLVASCATAAPSTWSEPPAAAPPTSTTSPSTAPAASYVGAGEVEGSVADRWAMDEQDGVLRLAVGPTSQTGDFNSIVTLRADGDELSQIGRLDQLGAGEQIKSVRWFDGLAILVTYRQVDPMYAVDLTDQADPTLLRRAQDPRLLRVPPPARSAPARRHRPGSAAARGRWGAQAGLFNVTDLVHPRQTRRRELRPGHRRAGRRRPTPVHVAPRQARRADGDLQGLERPHRMGLAALRVADGRMVNQMTQVEYGDDVDDVRLVPLPGRPGRARHRRGRQFFPVAD